MGTGIWPTSSTQAESTSSISPVGPAFYIGVPPTVRLSNPILTARFFYFLLYLAHLTQSA